jgi:hypothetical protein
MTQLYSRIKDMAGGWKKIVQIFKKGIRLLNGYGSEQGAEPSEDVRERCAPSVG